MSSLSVACGTACVQQFVGCQGVSFGSSETAHRINCGLPLLKNKSLKCSKIPQTASLSSPCSTTFQDVGQRRSTSLSSSLGDGPVEHGNVIEVHSAQEFEKAITDAGDKLVVLDISTKTCGPCKLIYPKLVKMSEEYPDAVFLKILGDYDSDTRALMREWKVRAVPLFRFYRNGEQIHQHSGAKEEELRKHFMLHYNAVPTTAST